MAGVLVGIDLGGTNVRAGLVSPGGKLLRWKGSPIQAQLGPQPGVERISALVHSLVEEAGSPILGIGIGSTGPVDRRLGAIQNPYTLPGWENVDIVSPLRERFGVPVVLENDADAAALGEAWLGAGRGMRRMAMVTVGTGIGFAFIHDGAIYRGMEGIHPEGGHIPIDPAGPECYCGAHGCLESLTAGPGIARLAQAAACPGSRMLDLAGGRLAAVDARILVRAAREGDPAAREVVEKVAFYLGLGLVNIIMLFVPEGIVMGGGVMEEFDLFAPGMRAVVDRHNIMVPADRVKILKSALEGQSGVLGAARAAYQFIEEHNS